MRPRAFADAVVPRQSFGPAADVGHSLNAVVAAEDVAAAAGLTHIAEHHLEMAVSPNLTGAVIVLRAAHGPDDSAGPVLGHRPGYPFDVRRSDTRNISDCLGVVLGDFFL